MSNFQYDMALSKEIDALVPDAFYDKHLGSNQALRLALEEALKPGPDPLNRVMARLNKARTEMLVAYQAVYEAHIAAVHAELVKHPTIPAGTQDEIKTRLEARLARIKTVIIKSSQLDG